MDSNSAAASADKAIRVFESHPDFAKAMLAMHHELEEVPTGYGIGPAIARLDIRAGAFSSLITDLPSWFHFMTVLEFLRHDAWVERCGYPIEVMQPVPGNADIQKLDARYRHWRIESLKRVAGAAQHQLPSLQRTPQEIVEGWARRQGLTREEAANELAVSTSAYDAIKAGRALALTSRGKRRVSLATLERVAVKVGCKPEELDNRYAELKITECDSA